MESTWPLATVLAVAHVGLWAEFSDHTVTRQVKMASVAEDLPVVPETMLAVRKTKAARGFELVRVPVPAAKEGQVLLKILACSLCGTDVHVHDWDPPFCEGRLTPPVTTGHETCAEVVRLGEGVTTLAIGDVVSAESHIPCASQGVPPRETCAACRNGNAHICERVKFFSVDVDGFLAQYAVAPANILWRNEPGKLTPEIAALQESLGNSVYTVAEGDVAGKAVAVFGCGPTGLNAIACAKALDAAQVIAVAGTEEHLALAKKMGATAVLNRHTDDVVARIRSLTGGTGAHVCLEMSGSSYALEQALDAVRTTGMVVILGLYASPVTMDWSKKIVLRDVTVRGIYGRKIWQTWELTAKLLERGMDVSPVITHRFNGLSRWAEGVAAMHAGSCGKVMFFPNEPAEPAATQRSRL